MASSPVRSLSRFLRSVTAPHAQGLTGRARGAGAPRRFATPFRRLLVALAVLAGVVGPLSAAWAQGELFVTNQGGSVTVFARTAGGNVAPLRTLSGAATGLSVPLGLAVDPVNDEIVVGNGSNNSVTVYARTASGNTAPLRTLVGAATGLNGPRGLAVDLVNNELMVANVGNNSVTVYARTANGNTAPLRTLAGPTTGLNAPEDLLVDVATNELVVVNLGAPSVTVYARTASGDTAPLRTLMGAATGLSAPFGLALDPVTDQLVVGNIGNQSVTAYPRTAAGNTAPLRTLTGATTGLSSPGGVVVDPVTNELLVANIGNNSVTEYPREATGNTSPIRILSGAATGLSSPFKLAVSQPAAPLLISTGTGPGGGPHVKLFQFDTTSAAPTQLGGGFFAYDPGFTGGVQATLVQAGGDLFIVTGVGSGGGPHIKLFKVTDLTTGTVVQIGGGFMAYDPAFTGGARVAATTDGAGHLLIVTGVGSGGGPHVKVFQVTDLVTGAVVQLGGGFFAYDPGFRGGVNVGAE